MVIDRVTVLLCASATGEKLMPLVIGRSANIYEVLQNLPSYFVACDV